MKSALRWLALSGMVAGVLLLSGCATSYVLDNNVQSFSGLTGMPAQPTYRFERLPSQQAPDHAALESMADTALHKAGLRRDDAHPRFSVQVGARVQAVLSPWADPWDPWGWGTVGWRHHRRLGFGLGYGSRFSTFDSTWYHREVSIIIRDLSSSRVVFEGRAAKDGPWSSNVAVFPPMFEAAMHGFPTPPAGPRQVNITVAPAP
jgi:hypothetical protein